MLHLFEQKQSSRGPPASVADKESADKLKAEGMLIPAKIFTISNELSRCVGSIVRVGRLTL